MTTNPSDYKSQLKLNRKGDKALFTNGLYKPFKLYDIVLFDVGPYSGIIGQIVSLELIDGDIWVELMHPAGRIRRRNLSYDYDKHKLVPIPQGDSDTLKKFYKSVKRIDGRIFC